MIIVYLQFVHTVLTRQCSPEPQGRHRYPLRRCSIMEESPRRDKVVTVSRLVHTVEEHCKQEEGIACICVAQSRFMCLMRSKEVILTLTAALPRQGYHRYPPSDIDKLHAVPPFPT